MTLFVSVWDISDLYIHCGFEIKTLGKTLTQDPILKPFHPVWQEGKGWGGSSQPRKKKTSNISLFLLAFMMDFHSMF